MMKVKKVGVIGGGQLAWMMGEAATKLGLDLIIQTPEKNRSSSKLRYKCYFGCC